MLQMTMKMRIPYDCEEESRVIERRGSLPMLKPFLYVLLNKLANLCLG